MPSVSDKALEFKENGYCLIEPSEDSFRRKCEELKNNILQFRGSYKTSFSNDQGIPRHLINILRSENKNAILAILKESKILDVVNEIFGNANLEFTHSKISFKTVGANSDWLSHQDNGYRLANGNKPRVGLAIMVFLEDVTPEDGPIQVIPSSHKNGTLNHRRIWESEEKIDYQLGLDGLSDDRFVTITGGTGCALLFDNDTIHRSGASRRSSRYCMIVELKRSNYISLDDYGLAPIPYNYVPRSLEVILKKLRSVFAIGRYWMLVKRSRKLTKWIRKIVFS